MIKNKKEFYRGVVMLILFFVVLGLFFAPLYNGQNGLNYMDSLYNSISKGSAYFIPELQEKASIYEGEMIVADFELPTEELAQSGTALLQAAGFQATAQGTAMNVQGDLGRIIAVALADADLAFNNNDQEIRDRYQLSGKEAMFNWWQLFKGMEQSFKDQKLFKQAKSLADIAKKGIETSYNYDGITPEKITSRLGLVIFSLLFYVIYTLWYGYAILFMFEGWGLKLSH